MTTLIPNSWVRLTKVARSRHKEVQPEHNEMLEVDCLLFLGEITQMPGHGIFAFNHGKIIAGIHMHDFEMILKEEI